MDGGSSINYGCDVLKPNRFASLAPGSLQPKGKKKKPVPKAKTPEAAIQAQVEAYIELLGLASFHIPDALLRAGFAQGKPVSFALINAAAEVRGFPDLIIFDPMRHGFVLCLELKTAIGTMTANQRAWQKNVGSKLCRSFEEAKQEIDRWMLDPLTYWSTP